MKKFQKNRIHSVINADGEMFSIGQHVYDFRRKPFVIESFTTRNSTVREEKDTISYIMAKHLGKDIRDNIEYITTKKPRKYGRKRRN